MVTRSQSTTLSWLERRYGCCRWHWQSRRRKVWCVGSEAADPVASTRRSHGGDHSLLWAVMKATFLPLVYVAVVVAPLLHRGLVRRPTSVSTGRPRSSAPLAA